MEVEVRGIRQSPLAYLDLLLDPLLSNPSAPKPGGTLFSFAFFRESEHTQLYDFS